MNNYLETFDARGHLYNDAMSTCPMARNAELNALLDSVPILPGQTIIDAPAGGGYVADAVNDKLKGDIEIICVEPSQKFASAIQTTHTVHNCPLDAIPLPPESIDVVLSLAGLHHVPDRKSIYREWARLLKPGGYISVGDVGADTPTGEFLNTFVDRHTAEGHEGIFIEPDEFTQKLSEVGLNVKSEALIDVPWIFPNRKTLGEFCHSLFGLKGVSQETVVDALVDSVGVTILEDTKVALQWQLQYAVAHKATQ